jgi:hypothetical protein
MGKSEYRAYAFLREQRHSGESVMRWMFAAIVIVSGAASAQAYTCAEVRALSAEQQAYYIKVFNITPEQQARIRQACYGTKARHTITVSDERPANRPGQGERAREAE